MPTVEDYLEKLDQINWDPPRDAAGHAYGISNDWDRRFISEVAWRSRNVQFALTTGQVSVVTKLIDRYRVQLELTGEQDHEISTCLGAVHCRLEPLASSTVKREVRWVGDGRLAFRFKFNPHIKDELKAFKTGDLLGTHKTTYEPRHKLWIVPVSVANYEAVVSVISKFGFDFDDDVAEFLTGVSNSRLMKSNITLCGDEIIAEVKDDALLNSLLKFQTNLWVDDV